MTDINIEIIYKIFFFLPYANVKFIVGEIERKREREREIFFSPHGQKLGGGRGNPLDWKLPNWFVDVAGANVRTSILI